MKSTLADSLAILLPALSPALASPEAVERVRRMGRALAPIPRGGFECRLLADDPQLDLQQCIFRENDEPARLLSHIGGLQPFMDMASRDAWGCVSKFIAEWAERDSLLHR